MSESNYGNILMMCTEMFDVKAVSEESLMKVYDVCDCLFVAKSENDRI